MTRKQSFDAEEDRWLAIRSRRPGADSSFVYAVKTTGVFCRPGCPSRLPCRENVVFFDTPEAAERAGFRPCRRCRPRGNPPGGSREARMERICRRIEEAEAVVRLETLAGEEGWSPWHLHRQFKETVGMTPRQYGDIKRMDRFREKLGERASVTEAIYEAGFGSSSRAYEKAAGGLGMAPSAFRRGGGGMEIRFATAPGSLGWVLVAATGRGICSVDIGEDALTLETVLRKRFGSAEIQPAGEDFSSVVKAVVDRIELPEKGVDLPLDIRGTAFQHRVWQALREIPAGALRSYSEIAEGLGKPGAARAVARACAANPVAVLIPCHRAVRKDGGTAGYRWGVERKKALQEKERARREEGASAGGPDPQRRPRSPRFP